MGSGNHAAAGISPPAKVVSLHEHIRELRTRVFVVALILIATSALAYQFRSPLIEFILSPLGDNKLIYLNPGGGFNFIFQVTLYAGMAATVPFFIYNLYRFISPALPAKARRYSVAIILSSITLLITGVTFGYIFAIPGALHFLTTFAEGYVLPSLTAESYLSFILAYTAGLGILFQLPLVLLFIHWIHPLKPGGLMKFQRYMIVIAFVAAALITPTPDVVNQTIIAAPIVLMYQIGVTAIIISIYRQKKRDKRAAKKTQKASALQYQFDEDNSEEQVTALAVIAAQPDKVPPVSMPQPAKVFDIIPPKRTHGTTKHETIRGNHRQVTVTEPVVAHASTDSLSFSTEIS